MSHTDRLTRTPEAFRQPTGITPAACDQRLAERHPRHDHAELRRKTRRPRRRKPGAGPGHTLTPADRLLVLLVYYRTDTTHAVLGPLFGIGDSAVGRNVNPLPPPRAGTFRAPERKVALEPDGTRPLLLDAAERAIPRPSRRQTRLCSGKKTRHAVKPPVVVVRKRKRRGRRRRARMAAASPVLPGAAHDKRAYDRTRVVAPRGAERTGDTAGLGTPLRTPPASHGAVRRRPARRPGTDR